jgi:radical SAM/Cys-rich protein
MPIQRFGSTLISQGRFESYLQLLKSSFQAHNLATVMCRSQISVDWQGRLYDCDFNQMLGLHGRLRGVAASHLRDLLSQDGVGDAIRVAEHCYGCTAGQGSSCGGALAA